MFILTRVCNYFTVKAWFSFDRKAIDRPIVQVVVLYLKVQMKCFFLFPNLKEQQKSGRLPFTVS